MRRGIAGLAAVLLAGACNALTGVDQLEVGSSPASTTGSDAATATDGSSPGSNDGATDDGGDVPLPTCGAGVCVPVPAGWKPVASTKQPTTPCPADYATSADHVSTSTYDTCDCACAANPPVSCPVKARIQVGGALCDGAQADITFSSASACTTYSPPAGSSFFAFEGGGTGPGGSWSCTPSVTPHIQAPPAVRVCAGPTGTPDGCGADQLCVPAVPTNARNCVVHDGDVQCPAGMNRRAVFGDGPSDTRACSSCTCANDNCASGQLTAYQTSDCSFGAVPFNINTCNLAVFGAYKFTPGTGCGVTTPSMVTGSLKFDAPKTLCCR